MGGWFQKDVFGCVGCDEWVRVGCCGGKRWGTGEEGGAERAKWGCHDAARVRPEEGFYTGNWYTGEISNVNIWSPLLLYGTIKLRRWERTYLCQLWWYLVIDAQPSAVLVKATQGGHARQFSESQPQDFGLWMRVTVTVQVILLRNTDTGIWRLKILTLMQLFTQ